MRGLWVTRSWMTTPAQVAQVVDDAERHGFTGDLRAGTRPRRCLLSRRARPARHLAGATAGQLRSARRARRPRACRWRAGPRVAERQPRRWCHGHAVGARSTSRWSIPNGSWCRARWPPPCCAFRPATRGTCRRSRAGVPATARPSRACSRSPIPEAAQERLEATIAHLTSAYALDGLHLDYIRYPSPDFDCSRARRSTLFREALAARTDAAGAELPGRPRAVSAAGIRRRLPCPLGVVPSRTADPAGHAPRRHGSRQSSRPAADRRRLARCPRTPADYKLQDWSGWLRDGLIDAACPMMYMASGTTFERQLQVLASQARGGVWPGIGAYKINADEAARRVDVARAMGFTRRDALLLRQHDRRPGPSVALPRDVAAPRLPRTRPRPVRCSPLTPADGSARTRRCRRVPRHAASQRARCHRPSSRSVTAGGVLGRIDLGGARRRDLRPGLADQGARDGIGRGAACRDAPTGPRRAGDRGLPEWRRADARRHPAFATC